MEADLAVNMINKINTGNEKARIGTIIMDDDSSTMAKINRESKQPIKKISDINHVKKSLGNSQLIPSMYMYCIHHYIFNSALFHYHT